MSDMWPEQPVKKPTTPTALDKLEALTANLVHHIEHEHPDPDMTEPCKFKDDVDAAIKSLIAKQVVKELESLLSNAVYVGGAVQPKDIQDRISELKSIGGNDAS